MKKYLAPLFLILLSLLIFTGCSRAPEEKPVDDKLQKKIISTYMEGLRDKDRNKIYNSVSFDMRKTFVLDRDLEQFFNDFEQQVGAVKNWAFPEGGSHVDELNGQAIIKTLIITTKKKLPMDIDLRRNPKGNWLIYAIKVSESGKKEIGPDVFKKAHGSSDKKDKK